MQLIERLTGMQDILPDEWRYWDLFLQNAQQIATDFGFERAAIPIIEKYELFARGIGTSADFFVQKEMYVIEESDGDFIALRPEFTAGVARAYVQNGMQSLTQPVKLYLFGPIFRRERPQAGRFRQHSQFNCEILNEPDAAADVEVMMMAMTFFERLGFQGLTFQLNSTGCKACRPDYIVKLRSYLNDHRDQLAPIDLERLEKNPLRVLDSKEQNMDLLLENAPHIVDHLCEDCRAHFDEVRTLLERLDQAYSVNFRLVRGMDYYEKTVFEVWAEGIGAQAAVCGGGRYNLAPEIGGDTLPSVGFGMGVERVILALQELGTQPPPLQAPLVMITHFGGETKIAANVLAQRLRTAGIATWVAFAAGRRSLKSQMREVNKRGARYALIIGDEELESSSVQLRPMQGGDQLSLPQDQLVAWLRAHAVATT